jgi:hypothetical protein
MGWVVALGVIAGCKAQAVAAPGDPRDALVALQGSGPDAFAQVTPRLYRGGPPSETDLAHLRDLGVTRVLDLRRGSLGKRNAERTAAQALGMQYVEYPFYGIFGVEPEFLDGLMAELSRDDGGAIYVHCSNGRDRTSLAIALHRVVADGWDPAAAWEAEALARGHEPSRTQREIALTFQDYVHEHTRRRETADAAVGTRRLVDAGSGSDRAESRPRAVAP